MSYRKIFLTAILAVTTLLLSPSLLAQAVNGTIVGTVVDPLGAVVPNAQVVITLTGQAANYTTVTNESGNFTEPNLPPGVYTITVTATGFKKDTRENITLDTNTTQRVDVALVTGSTSETITVEAAPPLLQTDRADISTTITSKQIADLPLSSGNSFQSLLNTVPGVPPVVFNNSQFFNANNDLSANANGQASYVNLYQIEGIDDDQRTGIHIILVPPAAAIANVDITTNNFEAEFGRAVGAVVNVTLKSGTNSFHGFIFQNMENNGVNARNYFAKAPNGRLVYNYTGASLGGPILKDKLFIFGDFLRVSDHELATNTATIPFYNVSGGVLNLSTGYTGQVYDPNTGPHTADCLGTTANNNCGVGRTPFIGNLIPLSNPGVSPVALSVLQKIDAITRNPATNLSSAAYASGATSNNLTQNLGFHKDYISYDIKGDWTITQKSHLSGRFSHQNTNTFQAPTFGSFLGGPAGGGFEATGIAAAYSTGGNFDHVFSPTLFTEARVGVAHLRNSAEQTDYGMNDAKALGIPGNGPNGTNNSPQTSGQVALSLGGFSSPLVGYSASLPWLRAESNIDFANNWTKILKNHTLKAGADIRRVRDDLLQGNNNAAAGQFTYGVNQTYVPSGAIPGSSTGSANDVASFLFNVPSSVGQDTNSTFPAYRQTWLFFFVSDKWQVNSKLTVDIGGRWEIYPPATPRFPGGFVNYNPSNNQLVQAGVGGQPSNLGMQSNYKNLAPRLGAAYRVTEKTVVRGGIGVSYVPFLDNNYAYNYPIKTSTNYNVGTTYGPTLNPAGGVINLTTGVPATPTIAFGSNGTLTESAANGTIGLGNLYIPLNFRNPYVTSWNVVVQQAFAHDLTFEVAYVANHGTRISSEQNINQPFIYGQSATYDPLNLAFGKTASVTQFFVGYSTNFQSMQVELKKRFAHGIGFASVFTWAKGENYTTSPQIGNILFWAGPIHRNWAVTDFDRTRNFAQTVTYELPAGRGHKYFNSGITSYVLGGWRTSAVINAVSGLPFTITANSVTGGTTQTADQYGPYRVLHNVSGGNTTAYPQWFDKGPAGSGISGAYFQQPANCVLYSATNQVPCALGNTGRNQFRGPGYLSDNLSIFKNFHLFRETNMEARFDAFNATNTPEFGLPSSSITSSTFGQITGTLGSGAGNVNGVGGARVLQAAVKFTF